MSPPLRLRGVDRRAEIRDFLISRRAKVSPEAAGLYVIEGDRPRRVPGLRREEVADLAGLSVDYYTQLERGDLDGASDSVLNAVARALHLDDAGDLVPRYRRVGHLSPLATGEVDVGVADPAELDCRSGRPSVRALDARSPTDRAGHQGRTCRRHEPSSSGKTAQ